MNAWLWHFWLMMGVVLYYLGMESRMGVYLVHITTPLFSSPKAEQDRRAKMWCRYYIDTLCMNVLFQIFACKTWPWSLAATKCKRSKMWNGKAGWRDINKYIDMIYPTFKVHTSKPCGIVGYPLSCGIHMWSMKRYASSYWQMSIFSATILIWDSKECTGYWCIARHGIRHVHFILDVMNTGIHDSHASVLAKNPSITQDHWHRWKHVMKVISATLCIQYQPFSQPCLS